MQGVKRRVDKFPKKEGKNAESYDTMVIMVEQLAKLKDDAKFEDVEDKLRALKESAASYERSHHRVIPYYWNDYGKLRYNLSKEMENFGESRLNMAYMCETVDVAKIRNEWVVIDEMTFSNANVLGGINTNAAKANEKDDSFSETIHIIRQEKAPGEPVPAPEKADEMIVELENGIKYKMDKDGGFGAMSGGMLEQAPNERKEYDHTKVKIIDQGGLSDKEAREAIKKSGESWEKNFPAEARKRKRNKIDIRDELKGKNFESDHSRSSDFSYKKDRISHL